MPEQQKWARVVVLACLVVLAIEVLYWLGVAIFVEKPNSAGTFGDMFGALNTFFAGLAFSGVVFTIYIQMVYGAEARQEQAKSLEQVQAQLKLLHDDIELQRRRDRVEAGPFFQLSKTSYTSSHLELEIDNAGAPVIVKGFEVLNAGCSVKDWRPSTLTRDARFVARCSINNPNEPEYRFRMRLRDRWGAERLFVLHLTVEQEPKLDFWESENGVAPIS